MAKKGYRGFSSIGKIEPTKTLFIAHKGGTGSEFEEPRLSAKPMLLKLPYATKFLLIKSSHL
jgi:hypothetical protein